MSSALVIHEIYGGAGSQFSNTTSTYNADYIVLYNSSASDISLGGYAIQIRQGGAGGNTQAWKKGDLSGTILAHSFFLIKMTTNAGSGTAPPIADLDLSALGLDIGPTNGRVALTNTTTTLGTSNASLGGSIVDFVGYGNAISFEGAVAVSGGANLSLYRNPTGGWDTDDNSLDLVAGTPSPHNSSYKSPAFTSSITPSVSENGTAVVDINVTDVEGYTENGGGVTYSIVAGGDGALFTLDADTGALAFASAPDFEAGAGSGGNNGNTYLVTVRATDTLGVHNDQLITVTVADVNEAPTSFTAANLQGLAENTATQTVVADLSLADPDTNGTFNTYTYQVSDVRFDVVGGQLVLKAGQTVNYESETSITLTVTATNTNNALHIIETDPIVITVTDVNEAPTAFVPSNVQSLAEDTSVQTVVADLTITDPDSNPTFNTYTYEVSDDRFGVVAGQLVLLAGQTLDTESQPSINLTVTATNTDNPAHVIETSPISITVTDVNEFGVGALSDINGAAGGSISENATGLVGVTARAIDADASNNTVTYSLVTDLGGGTPYTGPFAVHASSGVVTLTQALDFETAGATQSIFIKASSSDGSSTVGQFTVTLQNVATETIYGTNGNDTISGGTDNERMLGYAGSDRLVGNGGNDTLTGGAGRDFMTGGDGFDDFDFNTVSEIGKGSTRDRITDFKHGYDDIDVSTIDANGSASGSPKFVFLATKAFTGHKGELRWFQYDPNGHASDKTIIEGDINGDRKADFQIELTGLVRLTAGDFIL